MGTGEPSVLPTMFPQPSVPMKVHSGVCFSVSPDSTRGYICAPSIISGYPSLIEYDPTSYPPPASNSPITKSISDQLT